MIKLVEVSKSYGSNIGTDNLNLEINKGDVFGLLGSNGAGKTTTVKLIVGLLKPDKGKITINGLDVNLNAVEVKSMFGYKPEAPYLYEKLTAREFLHFIARIKTIKSPNNDINYYLNLFNLSDRADDKISTYSFGMKSKVSLCSAFIGSPQLIILDEPTNGLDPVSVYNMKELLIKYSQEGGTVLVSSHILDFIEKICTCYSIIGKGKLISLTTRDKLLKENKSLEQYFISSLEEGKSESTINPKENFRSMENR